jgi:hypothetical protein
MNSGTDLIILEGDPADLGRQVGALWREKLPGEVDRFFATMAEAGLETGFLLSEARQWEARMRDFAPHVLVEMEATGQAGGVDAERFHAYTALKYCRPDRIYKAAEWLEPLQECTSFLATGRASGVTANLLHKNRDAWMTPQSVQIKQVTGTRRVLGGGSVGDLGLCHALNDAGLAAMTNTGSAIPVPLRNAICNTLVLRHLAETCTTCEQALEQLREIARLRLSSNGINGCIWLLADREVGLIVEETPTQIAWRFIEDEVDARQNDFRLPEFGEPIPPTKRYGTALARMRELSGRVRPEDLNDLSRSVLNYPESICHDSTNSATTSVLPHDPAAAPYWEMAVGQPNNTLYLPMSPWATGLPAGLVDGSFWELSARLHPTNKAGEQPSLDFGPPEQRFRERFANAVTPEARTQATAQAVREAEALLQEAIEALPA